jgi:XrtJ-associated TM-motif-TM protein
MPTRKTHHQLHEFEVVMNLKKMLFATGLVLTLVAALPLRAQTGCTDSPEDPTFVLALVGGAGALVAALRAARSNKR